jgi:copper(I)-binding protein
MHRAIHLAIVIAFITAPAAAHDYTIGSIEIGHPWTRATPKGATVAGGYMTIANKGRAPDKLIGGSSAVAARFEVHRTVMEGGVMKMRPVEGGLEIKPGEKVELKPGSFHIMLMDLKQPLQKGERVKGTLEFEHAGKIEIEYAVEGIGAATPADGHERHHH